MALVEHEGEAATGPSVQPVDQVAAQDPGVAADQAREDGSGEQNRAGRHNGQEGGGRAGADPNDRRLAVRSGVPVAAGQHTITAAPNSEVTTPGGTSTPACPPKTARSPMS